MYVLVERLISRKMDGGLGSYTHPMCGGGVLLWEGAKGREMGLVVKRGRLESYMEENLHRMFLKERKKKDIWFLWIIVIPW